MLDEGMVALVADINLQSQGQEVVTNLEQSLLQGSVLMDGVELFSNRTTSGSMRWVHHNNILYLPALVATSAHVTVSNVAQTGSWAAINADESSDPVALPIFSVYLEHGQSSALIETSAAYAILPGVAAHDAPRQADNVLAGNLVKILRNDATAQAVWYAPSPAHTAIMATTWIDQAVITAPTLSIQVSSPATVIVSNRSGLVSFAVADPAAVKMTITIIINCPLTSLLAPRGVRNSDSTPLVCVAVKNATTSPATAVTIDLSVVGAGATVAGECIKTS
jgi:DNA-directed RNA polymerase subunit H (RpoH/RPB5)